MPVANRLPRERLGQKEFCSVFCMGSIIEMVPVSTPQPRSSTSSTYPVKTIHREDGVRQFQGIQHSQWRFVARGVVCMPPMFINVGAYVDEGTMVDSHVLIGSCAQSEEVSISRARRSAE